MRTSTGRRALVVLLLAAFAGASSSASAAGVQVSGVAAGGTATPEVADTPRGRVAGPLYLAAQFDRRHDQLLHDDYRERLEAERAACAPDASCQDADPYVAAWTRQNLRQERGELPGTTVRYELLLPREGARSPVDGRPLEAPYPAVVLLPGGGTPKEVYRGVAQGLATSGYAVLSVDPACNVQACGPAPSPDQQALGTVDGLASIVVPIVSSCLLTGCDYGVLQPAYAASEQAYQAAGAAGLRFLAARPALVDSGRAAVVGHSLGAYNAAVLAQRTDLPVPLRAAVAWDGFGALPATTPLRVPVQFHVFEGQDLAPHPFRPDESPSHANAARLRAAGVATGVVALRSSTHYEVGHLAYDTAVTAGYGSSRKGERVALEATLAWLDAHLQVGPAASRGRTALLSERLSGDADAVAHGQGTAAADGSNVPYRVAGEARSAHLSLLLRSWYDLGDGTVCEDLVARCR